MKPQKIVGIIIILFAVGLCGCDKEDDVLFEIEGLTIDNYPRVDSSTSTEPLNILIACKLFGWGYEWRPYMVGNGVWRLEPNKEDIPDGFFGERIKSSQTHNSIINLIDNQTDIILFARKMSADEKFYAEKHGVSLIETPIDRKSVV